MEIKIAQTVLDDATSKALAKMLDSENYSNPIVEILKREFSWDMNGEGKTDLAKEFKRKVQGTIAKLMDDPEFHTKLGAEIVKQFAEAAVKDLRNLKERERR